MRSGNDVGQERLDRIHCLVKNLCRPVKFLHNRNCLSMFLLPTLCALDLLGWRLVPVRLVIRWMNCDLRGSDQGLC